MVGRPGWVVARQVRRAAWWVFVVVALVAGRVSWLNLGDVSEVTYHGSYEPLNGVTASNSYGTALMISDEVMSGVDWAGPLTAVAAAVAVIAATVQADAAKRGAVISVLMVAVPIASIVTVTAAVDGAGAIASRPAFLVIVVLGTTALLEVASVVARPLHPDP